MYLFDISIEKDKHSKTSVLFLQAKIDDGV
jgi:hypothetical protein